MKASARITVSGVVQGVGYRYFCLKKAMEFGIKGYAKNLNNGNVELEAEGESGMINEFIKQLKVGPSRSIVKNVYVEEIPLENKYNNFNIR
ncbi:MAG: acylphosphatase [Ignavibacteria bacterium]